MTRRVSYAQNGEDVRVWRAFRDLDAGFYVEVGASDPYDDSTTAALSETGWSGLLVEADRDLAQRLVEARPRDTVVQAAAFSRSGLLRFDAGEARGLGTVVGDGGGRPTAPVPAVRVGDLLADLDPPAVHYMSVDVEGGELEALRGADLERWQPWVLSVESMEPNSRRPSHEAWEQLVLAAGYELAASDGLNRWYVAAGHTDLAPLVAEPLNALDENLDGWRRSKEVVLEEQVAQLHRHIAALEAAHEQALAEQDRRAAAALQDARQSGALALETALAAERRTSAEERDRLVREVEQLQAVAAERDAALAREQVLLTSKSWRLTKPLRGARLTAWLALRQLQAQQGALPPQAQREPDAPGDARRRTALLAKVGAARRQAGR